MRAAVTGAGGFIGGHLSEYLRKQGYAVRGIDKKLPEYRSLELWEDFIVHDLTVPRTDLYTDCDVVFHLACNMGGVGFTAFHAADQMRDNMLITINVMDGAIENSVERFFFASSACVYNTDLQQDPNNVVRLREDMWHPANPDEGYGWEKLYSEMMLQEQELQGRILARIGRFHNIYGEQGSYNDGREKAPAAICRKISAYDGTEPIEVWGTGEAIRTYIHVEDLVDGIYNLTMSDINTPINLGSEEEISVIDFYRLVAEIAGKDVEFTYNLDAPTGPMGRSCDLTFTRETLGWEPKQSLREGITRTYNWIDSQLHRRNQ